MGFSPPDSSVHGFFQARILEWVAISFSNYNPLKSFPEKKKKLPWSLPLTVHTGLILLEL